MADSESRVRRKTYCPSIGEVHPDVKFAALEAQTRRHFLRTLGSGVGTLFMGTIASQYVNAANAGESAGEVSRPDFRRDPTTPLLALPPQFPAKVRRVI